MNISSAIIHNLSTVEGLEKRQRDVWILNFAVSLAAYCCLLKKQQTRANLQKFEIHRIFILNSVHTMNYGNGLRFKMFQVCSKDKKNIRKLNGLLVCGHRSGSLLTKLFSNFWLSKKSSKRRNFRIAQAERRLLQPFKLIRNEDATARISIIHQVHHLQCLYMLYNAIFGMLFQYML